ncbi:MAG: glycosyl hydrolase [Ferruginibacter sp.]
MKKNIIVSGFLCTLLMLFLYGCNKHLSKVNIAAEITNDDLKSGFLNPPDSARPGVYWYFMDGNLTAKSMTEDLESMKKAGIGNLIFLEVNVGVPRGKVDFLSEQWQELFKHAVREAERLGIEITLGAGPGWTGSGGPWVPAAQSMQHLVSSTLLVSGNNNQVIKLSVPLPKKPFFGEGGFTPGLKKKWDDFYEDVAVLAFPTPSINKKITDIDEKALYYRAPYSSQPGVKQFLPYLASYEMLPAAAVISSSQVLDLTDKLRSDGTLDWKVPAGNWTIMRFGTRNNGAVTRPAPFPGLGFECDKFDTVALNAHLDQYIGKLLKKTGKLNADSSGGLKKIHMDSWEMGSQNWTAQFRQQFIKRRGYDPLPYYPVYDGMVVESQEISERFLWDLRQTSQELVLEYHAKHLKEYAHRNGLKLSIEPYDMNPTADLELGALADVPMCEFWSKGLGFNSSFSCTEATSIAHVNGISLVPAEAFTAQDNEGWKQHPGSMKEQGDWAFAAGINRFVYHTFQSQTLPDNLKPGMTMGPYGVHWDRSQTWWPMVGDYHKYISRCQYILQQGTSVADVLYLTPEGAPHVFRPPASALIGEEPIRDRRGYNFDGCSPGQLFTASVENNNIVFKGGASYKILVLPDVKTMTPALLEKIRSLIYEGAVVVGSPPEKSPGLTGFPACDKQVKTIAQTIWAASAVPGDITIHTYGKGKVIWGGAINTNVANLYPAYDVTAKLLKEMGVADDFESAGALRYTHRRIADGDIYFVANKTSQLLKTDCLFRSARGTPELWDPLTGETRPLPEFSLSNGRTSVPLQFESYQSFFIVFKKGIAPTGMREEKNFPSYKNIAVLNAPWTVSFDTVWGGPQKIIFDTLADWTTRPEQGIRYYSGIATYHQTFNSPANPDIKNSRTYLDLGEVKNIARIILNGKDLGVVWTAPWKVDITAALEQKDNQLEISVANLWPNRLIGDEQLPDDGIKNDEWPDWLLNNQKRTSGRFTFTTFRHYQKDAPLFRSGLIGPVTIWQKDF